MSESGESNFDTHEPVGFWVDKSWKSIREELGKRLDYARLEVLFSDGEPGIEENFLREGMKAAAVLFD